MKGIGIQNSFIIVEVKEGKQLCLQNHRWRGIGVNQDWGNKVCSFNFLEAFTSFEPTRIVECLLQMIPSVTKDMNRILTMKFSVQRVDEALFQIDPLSSPMPMAFQ